MKKLYNFITGTWIGSFGTIFFIYFFLFQPFFIPSPSMQGTLLVNDYMFVSKYAYGTPIPRIPILEIPLFPDLNKNGHLIEGEKPKRGDIVVFRYPKNEKKYYIKRNVAIGGDEVIYYKGNLLIHSEDQEFMNKFKKEIKISFDGKDWLKNPYKTLYPGIHYSETEGIPLEKNTVEKIDMKKMNSKEFGDYWYKKIEEKSFYMIGDNRNDSIDSRYWGTVKYKHIIGKPIITFFSFGEIPFDYLLKHYKSKIDMTCQGLTKKEGTEECKKRVKDDLYMRPTRIFKFIDDLQKKETIY